MLTTFPSTSQHKHGSAGFWLACVVLLALYVICQYASPVLVRSLFEQQRFDILDKAFSKPEVLDVAYYEGLAKEKIFGPLAQLAAMLLFAFLGLRYLKDAPLKLFAAAVLVFLLFSKPEVLFFPPYGDAVGGPFIEAMWLARNNFDYAALFHREGYAWGGPKVYMFSIFPTYLAALLRTFPQPKIFLVVTHLATFAMAAGAIAVLREIGRKVFDPVPALLMSLILLATPLFQSQVEAINMEMPVALLILLSAYFLIQRRVHLAGTVAVLAVLVKGTGVLACAAFALVTVCSLIFDRKNRLPLSSWLWSGALLAAAVLKVASKFFIHDQHVSVGMVSLGAGWPSLNTARISFIYLASGAVLLFALLRKREGLSAQQRGVLGVIYAYALCWFLLFLNFFAVSPRYRLSVYPFVVFGAVWAFSWLVRGPRVRKWILLSVLGIAMFSSYGFFYPDLLENDHVLLERSLEYRNDLKVNQMTLALLEKDFYRFKIGAPFVIAQMLAFPELGYISKDLDIMIYGFNSRYGDIEEFPGLSQLDIGKTVYVGVKVAVINEGITYPICRHDKIIKVLQSGNKKVWLFMGGVAIDTVLRANRMYMLESLSEKIQEKNNK